MALSPESGWVPGWTPSAPADQTSEGRSGSGAPRVHNYTVKNAAEAVRIYQRIRAREDMVAASFADPAAPQSGMTSAGRVLAQQHGGEPAPVAAQAKPIADPEASSVLDDDGFVVPRPGTVPNPGAHTRPVPESQPQPDAPAAPASPQPDNAIPAGPVAVPPVTSAGTSEEPAVALPRPEDVLALRPEGVPWDTPTGNGGVATSVIVPGTGGQTIDTTIRNADGTITQVRSVSDGNGGVTTWTANADGSYSVRYPDGTHGAAPGQAKTYTVPVGLNPAGPAPIESAITADGKQVRTTSLNSDGSVSTADTTLNPDGSVNTTYPDGLGGTYTTTSRFDEKGRVDQAVTGRHNADGSGYQIEYDGIRIDRGSNGSVLVTGTQDGTSYEKGIDSFGRPFEIVTDLLRGYSLKTWTDEFGRPHYELTDMVGKTITTTVPHGGSDGADRPWTEVTITDLQGNPITHYSKGRDGGIRTDDGLIHFVIDGQDVKYNSDGTVYVPDDHSTAWQRFIGTDPQPKVYFDRHGNPQLYHSGPSVPDPLFQIYPPNNVPGEAFYKTFDGTLIIKDKNGYHWGVAYDGPQILQSGPPIRPPGIGPSIPGEGVPPSRQKPDTTPGLGLNAVEAETPGLAGRFRAAPAAAAQSVEANLSRATATAPTSEAASAARSRAASATPPESPVPATKPQASAAATERTAAQVEVEARIEQGLTTQQSAGRVPAAVPPPPVSPPQPITPQAAGAAAPRVEAPSSRIEVGGNGKARASVDLSWPPERPSGPKPAIGAEGADTWRYQRHRFDKYRKGGLQDDVLPFDQWRKERFEPVERGDRPGRRGGAQQVATKKYLAEHEGVLEVENVKLGSRFPDGIRANSHGGTDYFEVGKMLRTGKPEARERIKLQEEIDVLRPNDTITFVDKVDPSRRVTYRLGDKIE
ncbi:hypothetical protein KP696_10415 [Nocardia seriolae]|uniref:hypothetical protein n=1 Tax=Nocardia seriolae TaxID=37332 RepID=UPI00090C24DE|nr:conserved hypothetical protein [Nocardia seriolae]BEK85122.1 hypothetical protein NSERKGN1266_10730 [Nocardia seriolae]GEM27041.1 hypothetical protein NS2_52800 [Nocardia seriolae NBRC 15557]